MNLLQTVRELAPGGVLPTTLVGWLTAAGLVITIAIQLVAMGRFLEKLNGFGTRLNKNETETASRLSAVETRENERTIAMERLAVTMQHLTKDVVAATLLIESCNEKDSALQKMLTDRLDRMSDNQSRDSRQVGERLARLETATRLTVRLRREEAELDAHDADRNVT